MRYVTGLSIRKERLLCTTIHHLTADEPRYTDVQEQIHGYHGFLEDALGSEEFGTSLDEYDSFIDDDEESIANGDPNEEGYQGPPYFPEIDEIIDNIDEERAANYYDQYIGAEVVIPVWKGDKILVKLRKRIKYDDISTG